MVAIPERALPEPQYRVVDIGDASMSALVAEVDDPRAVVVALHGGATTSAYYDCPGHPRSSLLRLGAAAGFTVVALDRPGYGSSRDTLGDAKPEERVDMSYGAVDALLGSHSRGAGVFVLAHSAGSELAVRMAVDERGSALLGLATSGTGLVLSPDADAVINQRLTGPPAERPSIRDIIWGPDYAYPADIVGGAVVAASSPPYERGVVERWASRDFPTLAPKLTVPVHFSVAEHERVWSSDDDAVAEIVGLFTSSPRVVLDRRAYSGHNLSLGYSAAAYHLKVLSFVEECAMTDEPR